MFNWVRKLPHPTYGKCGGASKDCSTTPPRDWMDIAFKEHDEDLKIASEEKTEVLRKVARKGADRKLAKALRKGDSKKLNRKIYGPIYLFFSKLIFRS